MKLRNKKTGEIIEGKIEIPSYGEYTWRQYNFDSIAELNEEWEDVEEPLIKDEKVRKAVRAWAEANRIDANDKVLKYDEAENRLIWIATVIDFNEDECLGYLKDGKSYTITELCGEEEE